MKTRSGFVSNSSSSSFVVSLNDITAMQRTLIENHSQEGSKYGISWAEDEWSIYEDDGKLRGYTSMDNFDMGAYLRAIGVDMSKVEFDC